MAQTKVSLIKDSVIVAGHLHTNHGITTDHIGEGSTRQYFTDARVQNYLSTNNYITTSDVSSLETTTSLSLNANVLSYVDENGTTTNIDLSLYLDDSNLARIVSGSLNSGTGVATFTRDDSTTFTVDFSAFLSDANDYVNSASFNTTSGVLTLTRLGGGTVTVDLDNRYLTSYTETDPVFSASAASGITSTNISNWNTAYGWGNHASAGYLTSYTETDTLATVTARGASTSAAVTIGAWNLRNYANQVEYLVLDNGNLNGLAFKVRYDGATANRWWDLGFKDGNGTYYEGLKGYNNTTLTWKGNTIWHAGNDGAGSGLDADLLDGQHASYFINTSNIGSQSVSYATNAGTLDGIDSGSFLRSDANDSYSGEITASGTGWYLWSLGSRGASSGNYGIGNRNDNAYRQLTFHVPNQAAYSSSGTIPSFGWYSNGAVQLMKLDSDSGNLWVKGQTGTNTPNGFRIDSSSYARIELDSNNNWSYVRLMDNGVTTWDIACYDSGNLEWRPGGSQTNRMTLDNGGRLRSNEFWAQTSTNSSRFTGAGDWGVRHYTSSGYIQLGPANTGHAHIYTDRSNFYFNKQIQLLGVSQINQNDIRTKIYYDWDDTNYYVDPAGGSLLSTLVLGGSQTRGTYTTASQYHSGADNLILKGNSSGISTIFFESEKDGTNINHPSDFGFIQFHPYGTGTSGEANELIIGVSNDADDHVVLNAPSINGLIFRSGASNTDYTVWHSGNDSAFIKTSNIGSQSVNYANSAGTANSVTWSNVSSKPAAWLNHAVLIEDKAPGATAFPSGFYQNYNGSGNPTGTWFNYINVRHSNTGNGHGYQLGMSYYDNNLWFRSYQGGTSPTFQSWETAIGSGSSNQTKTGYFQSNSSLRAPIFYDSNNTGYYCDPASTSNFNTVYLNAQDWGGNITWNSGVNINVSGESSFDLLGSSAIWQVWTANNSQPSIYVTYAGQTEIGLAGNRGLKVHGNLTVNHSSTYGTGMDLTFSGSSATGMLIRNNTGSTKAAISFYYSSAPQGARGTIMVSSTSTAYNTSSDYRLKENFEPITDGIDRVKLLQPKRFNFIGDDVTVDGFVAHETQEVVPESITGVKDEVDEDGNPVYQGIDQAKLVPLLTAALQEAIAKIEDLESRLQAIENQ